MSKMKINHWISGEKTSSDIPASPHVSASPSQPWSILFASAEIGQVALVLHLAKDTKEAWEEKLWFSKKNKIHLVTSQCCNPFLDKNTSGRSVQIIGTSLHETWTVFPSLVLVWRSYEKGKTAASPTYKNNEDAPLGGQIQKQEGASNWILPNLYIYK
jgi:hypothetical protein